MNSVKGIYFDFGYVIAKPKKEVEKKYFYLDWDGIDEIVRDSKLSGCLLPGVGRQELEEFFERELYHPFVEHEHTDLIDPNPNRILLDRLYTVFGCKIDQRFVDNVLAYVDTMKYIEVCRDAPSVLQDLKTKGYVLSLVSNMMLPGKLLTDFLRRNGLIQYFGSVTVSSEAGFIKPRKEIFSKTLDNDNLEARTVLFVGDTYAQDIVGAKDAGMNTAWLNCRHEKPPATSAADYEIPDLKAVVVLMSQSEQESGLHLGRV